MQTSGKHSNSVGLTAKTVDLWYSKVFKTDLVNKRCVVKGSEQGPNSTRPSVRPQNSSIAMWLHVLTQHHQFGCPYAPLWYPYESFQFHDASRAKYQVARTGSACGCSRLAARWLSSWRTGSHLLVEQCDQAHAQVDPRNRLGSRFMDFCLLGRPCPFKSCSLFGCHPCRLDSGMRGVGSGATAVAQGEGLNMRLLTH